MAAAASPPNAWRRPPAIASLPSPSPTPSPAPAPAPIPLASDSDDSSRSTDDGDDSALSRGSALEDSVFSAYLQISGRSTPDLSKIRSFLSSAAGRGPYVACLICLERVRPTDPTWSCSGGCHALFHLLCIQSWAQQSSQRPLPATSLAATPSDWPCPKCRLSYPKTQIPRSYFCFCGKVEDPPVDPWILPHSCGEVCDRPLSGGCGHQCLLLCHPGPCPPCPKLVNARCFCGTREDVRRCAQKLFSCNNFCPKALPCRIHRCTQKCHEGPCPPCAIKRVYRCACGKTEDDRECSEREFRCESPCDALLACGKHTCSRGCHSGPCGDCPLQGRRTCPCGKRDYKGISCDADVPTCGASCEKLLSCKIHRCPERCHRGPCVETCRTVIMKFCRCGSLKKEVPCYQDLVCERKCQQMRDCGRHACKRRCCDGVCQPCPEICGRKLRCGNHKCPSPCHRGVCAPCPLMVTISCYCGETRFEVPCGTERSQKPPRCRKPCHVPRLCRHSAESRSHKCHYGACPPCRMICEESLSCGHNCKQRCHGPVPPPNPEFTLKPTKKKLNKHMHCEPGSPCPPCQEVVLVPCLGEHTGEERSMLCYNKRPFSCQNLCGNLLPCGNHYCTKACHMLTFDQHGINVDSAGCEQTLVPLISEKGQGEPCEECPLPCQKVREPSCPHPCPLPCHSSDCPPCKVLIKRACHCGSMVHAFECIYYNSLSEKEQERVRSCGGPCHRKLLNCPHLCSELCHPGQCPSVDQCSKKVNVRCVCGNLKREWLCQDVIKSYKSTGRDPKDILRNQFGAGLLPCDADCRSKVRVVESELQLRKTSDAKNQITAEAANIPKRRKRRERVQESKQTPKLQIIMSTISKCLIIMSLFVMIVASFYYGYKGLLWISDWMDKIEEQRLQRRPRLNQ